MARKKIDEPSAIQKALHGPASPAKRLYGIAHLRQALQVSDAPIDELCEDAALRIAELTLRIPRKDR